MIRLILCAIVSLCFLGFGFEKAYSFEFATDVCISEEAEPERCVGVYANGCISRYGGDTEDEMRACILTERSLWEDELAQTVSQLSDLYEEVAKTPDGLSDDEKRVREGLPYISRDILSMRDKMCVDPGTEDYRRYENVSQDWPDLTTCSMVETARTALYYRHHMRLAQEKLQEGQ